MAETPDSDEEAQVNEPDRGQEPRISMDSLEDAHAQGHAERDVNQQSQNELHAGKF